MKRIGIIGSRKRNSGNDYQKIKNTFMRVANADDIIVSGGCQEGGDHFAEIIAAQFSIPTEIFRPEWKKYGRSAGFIRNTDIAKTSDILIACVAVNRKGGTEDTIKKFKKFHPEGRLILC